LTVYIHNLFYYYCCILKHNLDVLYQNFFICCKVLLQHISAHVMIRYQRKFVIYATPYTVLRNSYTRYSHSNIEEFRRQECEGFSIGSLINETLRASKTLVNIYQTTRRHVPEEIYLELLPLLLPVCAVLCLVSVVTGRYCTVGTTSAKSSIDRKCTKRVFAISSLLCARAASCCEDVALKLDYHSKCCFKNDSNNNYCTRGLLSDLPLIPDIYLNLSMSNGKFRLEVILCKN